MTPRRGKMSPRRARVSSGRSWEASGSDLGPISEAFLSNLRARARAARHPPHSQSLCSRCSRHVGLFASWCLLVLCSGSSRRSLCFSPRVFRRCRGLQASARARLQAGAASRMFSQPSPGSSQKAPKKTLEKLTKRSSSKPFETPGERAQESPRSVPGGPRRPKMIPRRLQMTPRRAKMSPRRARVSSGRSREVPGGFRERFVKDFRGISKQRDATETLPTQTAGEGA